MESAAAGDLQAITTILNSPQTEDQFRLLHARNLLDELRAAATDALAITTVPLAARTKSACVSLRAALDAAIGFGHHRRRRRQRGAVIDDLWRSLDHLREISSVASVERSNCFIRYDSFEIESAVRATAMRHSLAEPMVGRSEIAEKMKRELLAGDGEENGSPPLVMVIVGGPEIGKTRLANSLFNDAMVKENFTIRRWENISESLDVFKRRVPNIWFSPRKFQDFIEEFIHKSLNSQKVNYLIVLDDVWNVNEAKDWPEWDRLMRAFPCNGAVILTTRTPALVKRTAAIVPTTVPYFLQPLEEEHALSFVDQWMKSAGVIVAQNCSTLVSRLLPNVMEFPHCFSLLVKYFAKQQKQPSGRNFLKILMCSLESVKFILQRKSIVKSWRAPSAATSISHLTCKIASCIALCSHWDSTLMLKN